MFRFRNLCFFSLACITLAMFASCSSSKDSQSRPSASNGRSSGEKKYRIAVIPKAATQEFWKSVHAGAVNAGQELGNVEVIWKGPVHDDNREEQGNVVEDFVTQKIDGICLAPIDSSSLLNAVRGARQSDIPVVIFDSGLEDASLIVSYVATDNYNGGRLAAREMGKRLNGKGNVILLRYSPGSESTENRERGFLETISKEFPEIKMISDDQYSGTSEQLALDKSQQLLLRFRDQVNGVFAVNETSAVGMLRALEETDMAGKVVYIGFDASDRLVQALKDDKIQGLVLQDPVRMGYLAVTTMVAHLEGKQVENRVATGEHVATRDNMNEPEIHKLIVPEQFRD
jgi:ribose transport system substrate-binding protein